MRTMQVSSLPFCQKIKDLVETRANERSVDLSHRIYAGRGRYLFGAQQEMVVTKKSVVFGKCEVLSLEEVEARCAALEATCMSLLSLTNYYKYLAKISGLTQALTVVNEKVATARSVLQKR